MEGRSVSAAERLAVGSSRTMRSASRASARRISTCCCWAMDSRPTTASARRSKPESAVNRSNRSLSERRSMNPARRGSAPRKTFWATVSRGTRATSCATRAIPLMRARRGEPNETVVPRRTRSPWSCGKTPAMILPRVDLPAPFSPTNAWTDPARTVMETSSRARVAPNDLPMPRTSRCATSASVAMAAVARAAQPTRDPGLSPATPRAAGRFRRWPWSRRRRRAGPPAGRRRA